MATILFAASSFAAPARAQMVTGSRMEDFGKTFRISAKGWSLPKSFRP